jgi:hypothetical protein
MPEGRAFPVNAPLQCSTTARSSKGSIQCGKWMWQRLEKSSKMPVVVTLAMCRHMLAPLHLSWGKAECMHASIACLLLYEDYVWVSLGNAMKAKQSKAKQPRVST